MLTDYLAQTIEQLVSKVATHGFGVMDNFITQANRQALANEVAVLKDAGMLHEAGTGRTHTAINKQLRGDHIYWLSEADATHAQQMYFKQMEMLRLSLNQQLYLGLFALESHLALYATGTGYKKHIDRFKASNNNQPIRQISCILYLNGTWLDENGGHLRLYFPQGDDKMNILPTLQSLDILPLGGRLVIFLSDTFYHEVLPANKDRVSLTGWYLTR